MSDNNIFSDLLKIERNKIVNMFENLAENADADTQRALGQFFMEGELRDFEKSVKWFKIAAESGDIDAKYELASYYLDRYDVVPNEEEGMKYLQQIAAQGDPWAMVKAGRYYIDCAEEEKGIECFRKAAEMGDAYAQERMALHYAKDAKEAAKWCIKAAENDRINAQFELGTMYYEGTNGLEKDSVKAESWFNKAALNGDSDAEDVLELMHKETADENELKKLMHNHGYVDQDSI